MQYSLFKLLAWPAKATIFVRPVTLGGVLIAVLAGGCNPTGSTSAPAAAVAVTPQPAIDQAQLCEVKAWQRDMVASACKPGQKVVFLPSSWGNAQLPVIFAAVNCDLRYGVALTEGAVTCIYHPLEPAVAQQAREPASKP